MGTKFFHAHTPTFTIPGQNLEARAGGAGHYASAAAGAGAQKDIAAANALYRSKGLMPTRGDAASNAPGPKKV